MRSYTLAERRIDMVAVHIGDRLLESSDLSQCTLCGCWLPREELLTITRGIRWCGPCAAPHPELVPPPIDVIWPIAGGLLGTTGAVLLAGAVGAPDFGTSLSGLLGFLVGAVVGTGLWLTRPG
jgi:hypothetical protein